MLAAQTAAVVCAALDAALEIPLATISENATSWVASQVHDSLGRSQYFASPEITDVAGLIIAHSVCSLVWVVAVVTGIYCEHIPLWSIVSLIYIILQHSRLSGRLRQLL
jgi:hypothetical protein